MRLSFTRTLRTSISEQYNIFSDGISGIVGTLDVHIVDATTIFCRLILLKDVERTYDVAEVKHCICLFLEDLTGGLDESEIIIDMFSGKELGVFSSKSNYVL